MKYLVLIYANPTKWAHPVFMHRPEPLTAGDFDQMLAGFNDLMKETSETGELLEGVPLDAPETTKTIRQRDGAISVTDGPYAESKEQLAGYFVFECENMERAVEIASRFPDIRFAGIEVRPIMDLSGMEM